MKETKTKQTCAQGAGRVPRTRLLFAGISPPMIYLADGPTSGRYKNTRRKARREEGSRDKEVTTNEKRAENEQSYVQFVGQGRHNRHKKDRGRPTKVGVEK